jgi:hypothetical protein
MNNLFSCSGMMAILSSHSARKLKENYLMMYMQKVKRGARESSLEETLFFKKVPNHVSCGYHSRPSEKQLHRR